MAVMKRRARIGVLAVIIAAAALLMLRAATSPVMIRLKDPSAVDPADGLYVIFSPLRSREPEREAAKLLAALREGDCGHGLTAVASDYCDRERVHRLTGWTLVDRQNNPDGSVSLHYKVYRRDYQPDEWGNVWVGAKRVRGSWQLLSFDTYY